MRKSLNLVAVLAVIFAVCESATLPPTTLDPAGDQAFVVTTTPGTAEALEEDMGLVVSSEAEVPKEAPKQASKGAAQSPEIYSFHIDSNIKYRYSRTFVTSRVANRDTEKSQEAIFKVVLPETAFISKFIMEIDGKSYEAYVKEKEVAKNIYNQAQSQGQSAGLVEVNTRNANVFNVNVNVKAGSKVNFNLTYEELLSRRLGRYEQSINIIPDQINQVNDFQVTVNIEESQNITMLRVPQIRNDLEADSDSEGNNADAVIDRPAGNKANITWKPTKKDQAMLAKQGTTGKFIVQYDIKRELDAGEVLIMNGYFVHFFAPDNLPPLRKHVVFVLDVSGSMWGTRIAQLKESMRKILDDMKEDDFFNIITFSSDVNLWGLGDKVNTSPENYWSHVAHMEDTARLAAEEQAKKYPIAASKENIAKAQAYISSLVAQGGTNIHGSLLKALNLTTDIKNARKAKLEGPVSTTALPTTTTSTSTTTSSGETTPETEVAPAVGKRTSVSKPVTKDTKEKPTLPVGVESLILFLTDGEPTVGETNPTTLQSLIKAANANESVPIFSLAFGEGADFPFVRKLSLQNNGFARKIYEAADVDLQLKGFYNEIASPLLSNVKFNYTSPIGEISNLTITKYPTVFGGTEIAICGTYLPHPNADDKVNPGDVEVIDPTPTETPVEKIPRLEDSLALPMQGKDDSSICSYDDDLGFHVTVSGSGRDGKDLLLRRPCIWSSPIPWGLPVLRPFPPRPTPPPTLEDTFLEKMWAYLTVKQLIDQDLAKIEDAPSIEMSNSIDSMEQETTNSPVVESTTVVATTAAAVVSKNVTKETPKQRALRIALKYGFVTPLTSLVVVKPNSTDVENTRPADGSSAPSDSFAAPAFAAPFPFKGGAIGGYGGAVALMHQGPVVGYSATRSLSRLGRPSSYPAPMAILPAADYSAYSGGRAGVSFDDVDYEADTQPEALPMRTTDFPASTTSTTSGAPVLSLKDVSWVGGSTNVTQVTINGTEYAVADDKDEPVPNPVSQECTIGGKNETGVCVHVKDCVQAVYLNDFTAYESSYFCPIVNENKNYAGTCCPQKTPEAF